MLKTNFMGIELKNPIIVSAGPWNGDGIKLRENLRAGAGAVITETIVSDPFSKISSQLAYDGNGLQNIRFYSTFHLERWKEEMKIAKSDGGIVIASISGNTSSEIVYLAQKLQSFGADGIEISLSSPLGQGIEIPSSNKNLVFTIVRDVMCSVKIPVMIKLTQNVTNISEIARAAKNAGITGISAINTIRCILGIDIEKGEPLLPTYGGYSGPPIKPIGLASVAAIAQSVDIPICGVGGIQNYKNAIEYMMVGASAVQIGTAVMLNGSSVISEIVNNLEKWVSQKEIENISDICGIALKHLKPLDELLLDPMICNADNEQDCNVDCNLCIRRCLERAIDRKENYIYVDNEKCIGCGLCIFDCPLDKLKIVNTF
ncbi:MAG: 4Fe-4S binding protein [Peptostreptococcaceae bacterium]